MNEIHEEIKKAIAEAKQHAELNFADAVNNTKETHKGDAPREKLAIVPYTIVKCLSSLDNIHETRLFGWILAKAQSVLKLYNKDLSEINIEHAIGLTRLTIPTRLIIGEDSKNYEVAVKSFSLADKKIVYERDNTLYHLSIIAFPELRKEGRRSFVTCVIHNELWHALLDFTRGYRLFRLDVYMKLLSKYSVVMYLLISQQSGPKRYSIEALRQLLNCAEQKSYDRGANFFARIIDPARAELKEKAPWYFEYTASKEGRRHKYTEIVITPVLNDSVTLQPSEVSTQAAALRLRLDAKVVDYLTYNFNMTPREIETIEALLLRVGDANAQIAKIEAVKHRCLAGRVRNKAGYLVRTLQNESR